MVFVELQHLGAYLLETERHGNVLAYLEIAHVFLLPPARSRPARHGFSLEEAWRKMDTMTISWLSRYLMTFTPLFNVMSIEKCCDMLVAIRQVSEIVQYEGNCLPRLYLLVTVGMVWDAYAAHFQVEHKLVRHSAVETSWCGSDLNTARDFYGFLLYGFP